MGIKVTGRVGPSVLSDGTENEVRLGRFGGLCVQQTHGSYYEPASRGNLFTFGVGSTALAAANAVATGVTATAQPVIGVWNPLTSGVVLAISKVIVNTTVVANSAVNPGGFVWLVSTGQTGITAGSVPFSCKTLLQSGSNARAFALATPLTGLVGSLVTLRAAALGTINAAGPATAISQGIPDIEEKTDGGLIVPPGGVAVIMNQLSTTTVSVNVSIVWEEVNV